MAASSLLWSLSRISRRASLGAFYHHPCSPFLAVATDAVGRGLMGLGPIAKGEKAQVVVVELIKRPFGSQHGSAMVAERREEEDLEAIVAWEQRAFRHEALATATRNFGAKQKLGQGGFSVVYRGHLDNSREVAIKQGAGSKQGTTSACVVPSLARHDARAAPPKPNDLPRPT